MTLDRVKKGQRCKIANIPSALIRAQAIRFGIAEGTEIICCEVIPAGPVVISKNKQEIALGRGLARAIEVIAD